VAGAREFGLVHERAELGEELLQVAAGPALVGLHVLDLSRDALHLAADLIDIVPDLVDQSVQIDVCVHHERFSVPLRAVGARWCA
jgi:hypothetical protein